MVTTRDGVDLRAMKDFSTQLSARFGKDRLNDPSAVTWVVNRVPGEPRATWRDAIASDFQLVDDWFKTLAIPVYQNNDLADSYARSDINAFALQDVGFDALYSALLGA